VDLFVAIGRPFRLCATRDWLALATVLPVGIFFGAVHALTSGHGNAILALYLVSSRQSECLLLAQSGHANRTRECPLLEQQRTLIGTDVEWLGR
jgi:hypothetical protein